MPRPKKSAAAKPLKFRAPKLRPPSGRAARKAAPAAQAADYRHKEEALARPDVGVPAWFVDTDYNGLSFHVCQAFFPRTQAWDSLKRALKTEYQDEVWQHLAGNISVPFEAGEHAQIAVKVIDDRGNELMVMKSLKEVG